MTDPGSSSLATLLMRRFQRDFPLVPEPFAAIAERCCANERDVRAACEVLIASGAAARIGGVVKPNTIAASTLAAVSVPETAAAYLASRISDMDGINHVYLRENAVNIWFVATGPDRAFVENSLNTVAAICEQPVLDLRLEQAFHIDLGFSLEDGRHAHDPLSAPAVAYQAGPSDRDLLQVLTSGIPISTRPYREIGTGLGLTEETVITRLEHLVASGVVTRMGVIIRHRALGWRSNAMVVWDIPANEVEAKARILAAHHGINLCYRRRRYPDRWPYNLYCMIHAKTRDYALHILNEASRAAALEDTPRQILFSSQCYKQTGALIVAPKEAA